MSELYASLLMLGATISLGSVATGLVANQFEMTAATSQVGASIGATSAGEQLAYVYATVAPGAGCPTHGGVQEGSALEVTVFDYGSTGFRPDVVAVNGTLYFSPTFPNIASGNLGTVRVVLSPGECAHPWGQNIVLADADGVDIQFET